MKALALAILVALTGVARAAVPGSIPFAANLVDDTTGDPLTGTQHLTFALYDAATAGTQVWNETQDLDAGDTGVAIAELGAVNAFPAATFAGGRLYLEVKVGDTTLTPRVPLASVPYAIKSGAADDAATIGGLTPEQLQKRVSGVCGAATFVTAINPDGTVQCTTGATGTGDITGVTAGSGLTGGAASGEATLSIINCPPGFVLKSDGTTWGCGALPTGDITSVTAGPGLVGGGTTGDVTVGLPTTCGAGQLLKWSGTAWACANDIDTDTNAGGDITGVAVATGGGLQGGGTTGDVQLGLVTTCAAGQLLKWTGTAWGCASDVDTNSGGTITGVTAGTGLAGGGTTGSVTLTLDTAVTDAKYVKKAGDTMTGNLDMAQHAITNRACATGYVRIGPGLCTENNDGSGFTLATCANRCRAAGTHTCNGYEMRAILTSGVALAVNPILDWIDDQDADDSSLYVTSTTPDTLEAARATTTSSYCRCCQSTE